MKATVPHMLAIDPDRAIELLRAVVAEYGAAYTYGGPRGYRTLRHGMADEFCRYVDDDGRCACLIAHVLAAAGVPIVELEMIEGHAIEVAYPGLAARGVVSISIDAVRILQAAQNVQDEGMQWGVALDAAEREYAGVRS